MRAYKAIVEKTRYINMLRKIEYYPNGQLVESALDIETFLKQKFNMYFIKLEDLGNNLENMKKLSNVLNLKFMNSMLISTFLVEKNIGVIAPNKANNEFDNNRHIGVANLPRKDLIIINFNNGKLMKTLNYAYKLKLYEKFFLPIIFFRTKRFNRFYQILFQINKLY